MLRTSALLLTLAFSVVAPGQYAHTRGMEIVSAQGQAIQLRGINLGNWLVPEGYMWHFEGGPQSPREIAAFVVEMLGPSNAEKFWREYRDTYIAREDIRWIRQAGFNSIRVPLDWHIFADADGPGWPLLDRVVRWSHEEGLLVILDMHAAPGGQTGANIDNSDGWPWLFQDQGAQEQYVEVWKRIAGRYANESAVLGYDLLNEPLPHFPEVRPLDGLLEPLYKKVTAAIRQVDTHHVLFLEGSQWDREFNVFGPPFDSNAVYEFHVYDFSPDSPLVTTADVASYLQFRSKYNVPLWLGESGENTDTWVAGTRQLMESNHIGWAFWPYKKMDSARGPVTFPQPEGWSAITAYAKGDRGLGNIQERLKRRPPQAQIDAAFADLLRKITFAQEQRNVGYVRALLPDTQGQP